MNRKEFARKARADIARRLGEDYHVYTKEVTKNNGVSMDAILIGNAGQNITPTIYLAPFYDRIRQSEEWDSVMENILEVYWKSMPVETVDMDFYGDFDKVRNRIACKLIHAERNRELLSAIPHVMFHDLAVCFYYAFSHKTLGNGSILVYNTQVETWKTNTAELMRVALENTRELFGVETVPMEKLLCEMLVQEMGGSAQIPQDCIVSGISMQILSNHSRTFGAAAILLPGVLEEIADRAEAGLYILPSSVHEVILIPESGDEDVEYLKSMVKEVNDTQVLPEEILSDSVYYYDRDRREVICF